MRRALIACALVGCTEQPTSSGIEGESHVESFDIPGISPWLGDVLFVVDDSAAMAPYTERVAALAPDLVGALSVLPGGIPDLHVGAIRASGGSLTFIVDQANVDGTRTPNYQGTLEAAIANLLAVGMQSIAAPHPLATLKSVLDANPSGFLRTTGSLLLVIISASDDASPLPPQDYAAVLGTRSTGLAGIYPTAAPRLDAFRTSLFTSSFTAIDAADYATAFSFVNLTIDYAPACIPQPIDLAPDIPGPQYDCSVSLIDADGSERVLPFCSGAAMPCWEVRADANECSSTSDVVLAVPGYARPFRPHLRGQCVVK